MNAELRIEFLFGERNSMEKDELIQTLIEEFRGQIVDPEIKFDFLYREDELERLEVINEEYEYDY
jgi:hypothetical protein